MKNNLTLSKLGHTWFIDLDGTILKHNGYKLDGVDTILPDSKKFLNNIPKDDLIVLVTSRVEEYRKETIDFLNNNHIRYDEIIFNAPYGERIIVNDRKPSGLDMSVAINLNRDQGIDYDITIDEKL